MVGLRGQELIVEAAAVADSVPLGVEGQPGHEHQGGLVLSHRLIGDGLGNARVALGHGIQVIQVQKFHFLPVDLGNGYLFPVLQGSFQHGHRAYLLVVGKVAVDGFRFLVGLACEK